MTSIQRYRGHLTPARQAWIERLLVDQGVQLVHEHGSDLWHVMAPDSSASIPQKWTMDAIEETLRRAGAWPILNNERTPKGAGAWQVHDVLVAIRESLRHEGSPGKPIAASATRMTRTVGNAPYWRVSIQGDPDRGVSEVNEVTGEVF